MLTPRAGGGSLKDADGPGLSVPEAVREIARELGRDEASLPAYVYDLDGLAAHVAGARAAVGARAELFYAVKANPDPALVRVVAGRADGLEVSSGGELRHVIAAAAGARLAFGGPGKTAGEIAAALAAGVARFHVESLHELRLLGAAARAAGRRADILLRASLAAGQGGGPASAGRLVMGGPSPFGLDPAGLDDCAGWLAAGSPEAGQVRLRGLHAHLASGLDAPAPALPRATASRSRCCRPTGGRTTGRARRRQRNR